MACRALLATCSVRSGNMPLRRGTREHSGGVPRDSGGVPRDSGVQCDLDATGSKEATSVHPGSRRLNRSVCTQVQSSDTSCSVLLGGWARGPDSDPM